MFELNLFHEQQQFQHERDYDPVRLTVLGGMLILSILAAWYGVEYLSMAGRRKEITTMKTTRKQLENELKSLGTLTDLAKIQSQAQSLEDHIQSRTFIVPQLDLLRDIIPSNCQVRTFRTVRSLLETETIVKGAKKDFTVRKVGPALEMVLEIETRGKTKVDVLQARDNLLESFRREPRLNNWIKQTNDTTNVSQNCVVVSSSSTFDPKAGEQAIGIFEFKLPFALKDQPKEL